MNEQEKQILDMLCHFFYVKSYITDKKMCWAVRQVIAGKNPFLELKTELEANHGDFINFDNPIFSYRLENDSHRYSEEHIQQVIRREFHYYEE